MLVVLFAVAEVALAVAGVGEGAVYVVRPGVRWAMEENLKDTVTNMAGGQRAFLMSTNEDGLRTRHSRGLPEPGVRTFFWTGDSRIVGWGVEDGQDPPALLELVLSKRFPDQHIDVVNGGSPGYSSVQGALLLQEIGIHYHPDVVIFEMPGHDMRLAARTDRQSLDPSSASAATWFLAGHSRVYRLLRRGVLNATHHSGVVLNPGDIVSESGAPDPNSDRVRVPPADLEIALRAAAGLGEKHHFKVAATFPCNTLEPPKRYRDVVQHLVDEGIIGYIDYATPFSARGGLAPELSLVDSPGHHTAYGNALAAKAMADALEAGGYLP